MHTQKIKKPNKQSIKINNGGCANEQTDALLLRSSLSLISFPGQFALVVFNYRQNEENTVFTPDFSLF